MKRASQASSLALLAGVVLAGASLLVVRAAPGTGGKASGGGASPAAPAKRIAPAEAGRHAGENAMVCGLVAAAKYAAAARGRPTFLDFGGAYPDQVFQVVIWGAERGKFHEAPEQAYAHKQVCVTGQIRLYRGKPEIVVGDPAQLVLDKVIADPDFDQRAKGTG
ncbi:MAG TPA: hypothetical protein VHG32_07815 [Thermoanaerobaculia bacterium]|nr:hypothetical protein [Thermoanaerobaculia bacterium]